jgi:cellobiose dehydrogenase (acceptor)
VTGVEIENTQTNIRSTISICSTGRVVLAAGAMSSPRILINSGIGPAAMINIVANGTSNITLPDQKDWISLPVGTVIKDHPIVSVNFNTTSELIIYPFASALAADQELYYTSRTGVLAQGYQRLVFWDTFTGSDGVVRYIQGTTAASKNNTIQVKFYLTHGATSSGELGIDATGSTYFVTKPWFTTDEDKNGLAAYIDDFIAKAANGTAMVASTSATGAELIVSSQSPGTHYVGTAVMGTDDGRQGGKSVVDLNTKVYGTDNLFVVDASVHPDLPTGNTMAIVMVVAEAAVKKILAC